MDDGPEDFDAIETVALAVDEEPDGPGPHVIVLQALSGEYRVIVKAGEALEAIAPHELASQDAAIPRDAALMAARRLARERGLASIYLCEDM
jgi:hypothetical protein